jgi:hypothetical protein
MDLTQSRLAVAIPADAALPVAVVRVAPDEAGLRVGRTIDVVVLGESGAALLVNGDGRSLGLPENGRATRVGDRYVPGFGSAGVVVGDALVVGMDSDGSVTDVPAEVSDTATNS